MLLFLGFAHLIGVVIGVGAATVKLALLFRCNTDHTFIPAYMKVAKVVTRQIILGLVLMTASGIGLLIAGYPLTPRLVVKLILVGAIWVMGPIIDNVVEPRFQKLVPAFGERPSPAFGRIQKQYFALEFAATGLFFVIMVLWVLV